MQEIWTANFSNWRIEKQESFKDFASLENGTIKISDREKPMMSYTLSSPPIAALEDSNELSQYSEIAVVANVKLFINQGDNAFIGVHNGHSDIWLNYQIFGDSQMVSSAPNNKNLYDIAVPVLTYDSNEEAEVKIVLNPALSSTYDILGAITQLKLKLETDLTTTHTQNSYFEVRSLKIMGKPTLISFRQAFDDNEGSGGAAGPKVPPLTSMG
jgi:hypothetical protein